jgi:Zn-dependent protease
MSALVGALQGVHGDLVLYLAAAGLIALVVHEYAHAFVASRLGDSSPRAFGRLTLSPKAHADPFGTYVLPAILLLIAFFTGNPLVFAYAKPMPLNPWNTGRRTRDTVLIQAAGPAANLVLAFVFAAVVTFTCGTPILTPFLDVCVITNALFAAAHIVPVPPLDGARAIAPFLSPRAREVFVNMEQYAALFMLLLFFILGAFFLSLITSIAGGIIRLVSIGSCG